MADQPLGFFEGTEMPTTGWWEALWPDPRNVITAIGVSADMDVIDLCCGDGWFTVPMCRLAQNVIAIDIDPVMLDAAGRRLSRQGIANCALVAGNAYDVAKIARPVDLVFMANAFHGAPDRPRLVRAVRDVLKPSGRFAIINWHRRPREQTIVLGEPRGPRTELRMSPEDTIAAVSLGGMILTRIIDVAPYHYGAVFVRSNE